MKQINEVDFLCTIQSLAEEIHHNARDKGFYDPPPSDAERIALMHSELSEALEYIRHGNPKDDHIPEFSGVEAEMADTIIRILDYCVYRNLNIGLAILAKHAYNKTRPHMHGGKKL